MSTGKFASGLPDLLGSKWTERNMPTLASYCRDLRLRGRDQHLPVGRVSPIAL